MIITADIACWHTGTRIVAIITSLSWYLLMSPGFASTTLIVLLIGLLGCFVCLFVYLLFFVQQSNSFSTTWRKTRARPLQWWRLTLDPWGNIASEQCWRFQVWRMCANMQRRQWWSGVSLGCAERYPATTQSLWTLRTKTCRPIRLVSSTPILDADKNLFPLIIWRRGRSPLLLMWSPSIGAHVAPG